MAKSINQQTAAVKMRGDAGVMSGHSTWTTRLPTGVFRLLALLALCSAAAQLYADNILAVDMSNVTFRAAAGNDSCGTPNAPVQCTETFSVTFQWDNTTESALSGTLHVDATGALSVADVAGPWIIGDNASYFPPLDLPGVFLDLEGTPDFIFLFDTDFVTPLVPGTYPGTDASMQCYGAPTECDSLLDFTSGGGIVPPTSISGEVTITETTPEPGTLALFVLGTCLIGAGMLRRRKAY